VDAHPNVTARALARLAILAALACASGCPTPPGDEAGTGGATAGGEDGGRGATDTARFPESALDPWAGALLAQARARAGEAAGASDGSRARIAALVVRADVAFPHADGGLRWVRASFVLGSFGLRLVELAPRGITDPEHGEPPSSAAGEAVARAAAAAASIPALSETDCSALPAAACEPLLTLDRTAPPEATAPARVALAAIGAILVTSDDHTTFVDLDP
jgi:hypothetical protein